MREGGRIYLPTGAFVILHVACHLSNGANINKHKAGRQETRQCPNQVCGKRDGGQTQQEATRHKWRLFTSRKCTGVKADMKCEQAM